MEKFTVYSGTTVPLMNDNIDTDQIIPKNFLKQVDKAGFGKHLFDEWRHLEDGSSNPEFILNAPERQQATILISGENFGSGSSREHAAWALQDYGFKVIIAGSYSDIFYMNALKNGLLPIRLNQEIRTILSQLTAQQSITIDLPKQEIHTQEASYPFQIDATWKEKLVNGLDDISITMQYEDEIQAYEKNHPAYK
ncbi:3-isopropylmalate dehydratase, small subunit [Enterococcus sp. AZ194]|uniref:3-isopropylmalate dehydratase small subunit n=1 Tax=Enterococcus sp. AZ194 TaxID=2774629 RepID=UPI003F22EA25